MNRIFMQSKMKGRFLHKCFPCVAHIPNHADCHLILAILAGVTIVDSGFCYALRTAHYMFLVRSRLHVADARKGIVYCLLKWGLEGEA